MYGERLMCRELISYHILEDVENVKHMRPQND